LPGLAGSRRGLLEGNFGLSPMLHRATGLEVSWAILAACLGAAAYAAARAARRGDGGAPAVLLCAGCAAVVLSARLAWTHYYLLSVPLFAWVLRPAARAADPAWMAPLLALGLAGLTVIPTALFGWPSGVRAVLMNAGVAAFLAAALRNLARPRA
jgi:hypothetical protein